MHRITVRSWQLSLSRSYRERERKKKKERKRAKTRIFWITFHLLANRTILCHERIVAFHTLTRRSTFITRYKAIVAERIFQQSSFKFLLERLAYNSVSIQTSRITYLYRKIFLQFAPLYLWRTAYIRIVCFLIRNCQLLKKIFDIISVISQFLTSEIFHFLR